ncbi:DUF5448 family protein [Salmonella enterica]
MSNIDKLNDHELVDLKKDIERELKRRAAMLNGGKS